MRKPTSTEIEAWKRRKLVYERRQRGETQDDIARDLGISAGWVSSIANEWGKLLRLKESHGWYRQMYRTLQSTGIIAPERSKVYGYA